MPVWYVCRNSLWQWKPSIFSQRLCRSSSSLPAQHVIWNHKFLLCPQKSIWYSCSLDGLLCCTLCSCSIKSFHKILTKNPTKLWKSCQCNSGQTSLRDDSMTTVPTQQGQGPSEGPQNQTNPSDLLFPEKMIHINASSPLLNLNAFLYTKKLHHLPPLKAGDEISSANGGKRWAMLRIKESD